MAGVWSSSCLYTLESVWMGEYGIGVLHWRKEHEISIGITFYSKVQVYLMHRALKRERTKNRKPYNRLNATQTQSKGFNRQRLEVTPSPGRSSRPIPFPYSVRYFPLFRRFPLGGGCSAGAGPGRYITVRVMTCLRPNGEDFALRGPPALRGDSRARGFQSDAEWGDRAESE